MEEKVIGEITHYFGKVGVGIIRFSDALKIGDSVHIKGHSEDFTQQVTSMQVKHMEVTEAKAGDVVGIKVDQKIHAGDSVYKVT